MIDTEGGSFVAVLLKNFYHIPGTKYIYMTCACSCTFEFPFSFFFFGSGPLAERLGVLGCSDLCSPLV